MKNDILLFAIMFAVALTGYYVAKNRWAPVTAQATIFDDVAPGSSVSMPQTAGESLSAVGDRSKSTAASTTKGTNSDNVAKSSPAKTAQKKIERVLRAQVDAWNQGDLDGFMEAYWNDKALMISGGGDTIFGWAMAYDNYRQRYPEGEMGTIQFNNLKIEMVGKESASVTGRLVHQLADTRTKGNFSLIMKRVYRQWKIAQHHTSFAKE